MVTELRNRNQAAQTYVQALSEAWMNGVQLYEPSIWRQQDYEVEEKMLRDADIRHAIQYRMHLIAGRQWDLQPKSEDGAGRSNLAVEIGTKLLKEIRQFTSARFNLSRAFFSGSRYARVHFEPKRLAIGDGRTRTWLVPIRLEDQDTRQFRIVPHTPEITGGVIDTRLEQWDVRRREWLKLDDQASVNTIRHVYQDDQPSLGYGQALREALGWWWYAKEHAFAETLQAVERFAQGILHAKVDGLRDAETQLPNREVMQNYLRMLENMRSRHVLVTDNADNVEVITPSGEGWQLLSDVRQELRQTITTLILSANLTTTATEGGSYALGEIQENSTEALIQFDRELLEECITDGLLGAIWWNNWPNLVELQIAEEQPRFNIKQEKKLDPQVRADVAERLNRMGVAIAADDLYEQTGFRKPKDGEEVIEGQVAAPAFPGGGFDGLGAMPFRR